MNAPEWLVITAAYKWQVWYSITQSQQQKKPRYCNCRKR